MAEKINLNKADEGQLRQVQGIGDTHARQVIELRDRHGGLKSFDDLRQIEGLSDQMVKDIADQATL